MTVEEEQSFLSEQLTSAANGEFVTVESLYRAYQDKLVTRRLKTVSTNY
ncbi:hypothetical protein HO994_07255 [Streptococcus suis]|nr:hypothetical protein [Streptococcus suis]